MIEAEIKDWPAEVKNLDPGKDNLDARLDWVERSRSLAQRLKVAGQAPNLETGGGGGGKGAAGVADKIIKSSYFIPGQGDKK
jgi:hypothetical protein